MRYEEQVLRKTALRSAVAGVCAALAVTVSACGVSGSDTSDASPTSEPTTSEQSSTSAVLAGLDPCSTLESPELTELGLEGPGEAKTVAGAETCRWRLDRGVMSVGFHKDRGLGELNFSDGEVEDTNLEGRPAKLTRGSVSPNACDLTFAASEKESVTVSANTTDTETACQLAEQAAPLVAAKLPQE